MTILQLACCKNQLKVVEMLITRYKSRILSNFNGDINTFLHYVVSKGQTNIVKLILTKLNSHVDCRNGNKESPLHIACIAGHIDIIKILVIEHGANLDVCDHSNNTPLHTAAIHGQTAVVRALVKDFGCDPISKGHEGATILHYACQQGHTELMITLLSSYTLNSLTRDDDGNTPLHYAAFNGVTAIAHLLIKEYSCPVDCRNKRKQTPLHLACSSGHLNVVQMLVSEFNADLNARDADNDTPLHTATLHNKFHIIKHIIHNFNAQAGNKRKTILHDACQKCYSIKTIEVLMTDCNLDPMSADDDGNTPLHLAAMCHDMNQETVKLLINKFECPVDCRNSIKQSSLHLACSTGNTRVITTLLSECKADLFTQDINNNTPLHMAVQRPDSVTVVDCIIKFSVLDSKSTALLHFACQEGLFQFVERSVTTFAIDPMITDDSGNTPLHYAALGGRSEIATLLITKCRTPVNHQNKNGETPLHLACGKGHCMFIQTLLTKYKADINTCDVNNDTPLQRAALNGQAMVVCFLILYFSCDPNVTGAQGRNLLHYACLNDHDELAWTLINTFKFSLIAADVDGNSPLHTSAMFGQNKCVHTLLYIYHAPVYLRNNLGKSALEVARNEVTRNIIDTYLKEEGNRIQYDYKEVQNLSKKKYSGAQTFTRVFVLGNAQSGKSTLIESLKRQEFFSSFNQVSEATVPPHTSGIIPSEYQHKTIGRVLYYDFAGDPEYYSSHSAIMSSVVRSKEGSGTNICLILVNFKKEKVDILPELGYWLSFILYNCEKLKEKCKVLIIGSYVDLIAPAEAKERVDFVSQFIQMYLSHMPKVAFEVIEEYLALNCCNPRSSKSV